jgi:RNA polymerase sigma factor (sigma-70 family)
VDYQKLLTDNLSLLQRVVQGVARRHRLRPDEADDIFGDVQLKLVENDYQILRQFQQRASLRTYLTVVVTRHVLDKRNALWGKWRPSAYAKRLGPIATQLERFITRDGLSFQEAVQSLRMNYFVSEPEEELYRMSLGFPDRLARSFVNDAMLHDAPGSKSPEPRFELERRAALSRKTGLALNAALAGLDTVDRLLLKMYFKEDLQISSIAKVLKIDQKLLYRRKERVLAVLARELAAQGVERNDVLEILGEDLEVRFGDDASPENGERRPTI